MRPRSLSASATKAPTSSVGNTRGNLGCRGLRTWCAFAARALNGAPEGLHPRPQWANRGRDAHLALPTRRKWSWGKSNCFPPKLDAIARGTSTRKRQTTVTASVPLYLADQAIQRGVPRLGAPGRGGNGKRACSTCYSSSTRVHPSKAFTESRVHDLRL